MRIALFTHRFLEPTHHAIAQLIGAMNDCKYTVFAKHFDSLFELPNVIKCVQYAKGTPNSFSSLEFDLVHAVYDGKTAMRAYAAAAKVGLPFVLSFHGGFDTHSKIHDLRYRDATRFIVESSAQVTVPSPSDIKLLAHIGVNRIPTVLPVPVSISARDPSVSPNSNALVLVGRLIPKKGIDIALKAMSLLPGYFLNVIGDGELHSDLCNLASSLGLEHRVKFLGLKPLKDVEALLASSFALLHPARVGPDGNAEGTPQIVLMAQAMGVPVVASDSGNLSDVVEDGRTGILVVENDFRALATAVIRLSEDTGLLAKLRNPSVGKERSVGAVSNLLRSIYHDAMQNSGC